MRPFHALLSVVAAIALAACSTPADTRPAEAASDVTVTLERSPCFGFCPSYSVTMAADGRIEFEGRGHVQTTKASGQATPEQQAAILAAIKQSDFASLRDSYFNQDDGCGNTATDMPGVKITVADASGSKSVDFYYGCMGGIADTVKPRIDQLAKTIDAQLGTAQWIGKPKAAATE